jgi:exo-beta-1,3-glucanase (GH17 family)
MKISDNRSVILLCILMTMLIWMLPNMRSRDVGQPIYGKVNSISFAPFRDGQSPLTRSFPSEAQVEADLALVASRSRAIRTYASSEGGYNIAAMAERHGLRLWLGAWLGRDSDVNAQETSRAVDLANAFPNTVDRVVVGNEVLLRRDLTLDRLIQIIDEVKGRVSQPVTYADVWEFWLKNPELASHVDIITIHILPYWEDIPVGVNDIVAHVGRVYAEVRARFPDKRIAIGEIGWPSSGRWRGPAAPSRLNQATALRSFLTMADREGLDYNIIEAFDQNWKRHMEGVVGGSWGLWNSDRTDKNALSGPILESSYWFVNAAWSGFSSLVLIGIVALTMLRDPWGAVSNRNLSPNSLVVSCVFGNALVFAIIGSIENSVTTWEIALSTITVLLQVAMAVVTLQHFCLDVAGGFRPGGGICNSRFGYLLHKMLQSCPRLVFDDRRGKIRNIYLLFLMILVVEYVLVLVDGRYRAIPFFTLAVPAVVVAFHICGFLKIALPRSYGFIYSGTVLTMLWVSMSAFLLAIEGVRNTEMNRWIFLTGFFLLPVSNFYSAENSKDEMR